MFLVIGHKGRLGSEFMRVLGPCATHPLKRVGEAGWKDTLLGREFRAVINCAAYTDVDGAESDSEALRINSHFVGEIAEVAQESDAQLVHFSTDMVYGGGGPHSTGEAPDPQNAYGLSKLQGEMMCPEGSLIIRTQWLCVKERFKPLYEGKTVKAFTDIQGGPTTPYAVVMDTLRLIQNQYEGIVNLSPREYMTWKDVYDYAAKVIGSGKTAGIKSTSLSLPAKRNLDSRLAGCHGSMVDDWKANLDRLLAK